ncbi:MAG: UDP-N-acetylmuramoyl-L-alanine--D-glutamate ligase [Lentisphaeria bacterium]|nr:UDP-N-acetylmuramoyl-L-alanine--D-glutamate ligase [Lentisphaeria bacterium]
MSALTIKIFPLCAVLISIFAYFLPETLSPYGFMIIPLLGIIMAGMGATLSVGDFVNASKNPRALAIGMVLQFLLMPLIAFAVGHLLKLPQEQFIGVVMVGTVAGGTASNVITYLAGGNVALSITMTACSTAAGVIMTPLLSWLYLGKTVHVPVIAMFQSILFVVALPVASGLLINRIFRKNAEILNKVCPVISVTGIVLVIGIIMSLNVNNLKQCGMSVLAAVILHNLIGMTAGYYLAKLFKCNRQTAITIAIEVGMQNSGLAAALSKQFFGVASALPGAIFSVWHNISGAIFASFAKKQLVSKERLNLLILGKGISGNGAKELADILEYNSEFANDGDEPDWKKFDLCVTSPGFAMDSPLIKAAREHGLKIISEMEFGFLHFKGRILAITGTNGKTTTTELTCALLKSAGVESACAGNIGLPLSSLASSVLRGELPEETVAVLEVSSFQLEHIEKFSPYASCFTNLASDHLNRYNDSLEEYKQTKMRIFNGVDKKRCFFGSSMPEKTPSAIRIDGEKIYLNSVLLADYSECRLRGIHNLQNLECALNLTSALLSPAQMQSPEFIAAMKNFQSGRHRIEEFFIEHDGKKILCVNDSKATNPHSVAAACKSFGPPQAKLRIILGGLDKDMDFSELLPCVPYFAKCYLIGEAEDKIAAVLGHHVKCQKFGRDFQLCCQTAKNEAADTDIIILSPACASMDMFRNYAERGDRFKEYMQQSQ